jgi:hypothetical protein
VTDTKAAALPSRGKEGSTLFKQTILKGSNATSLEGWPVEANPAKQPLNRTCESGRHRRKLGYEHFLTLPPGESSRQARRGESVLPSFLILNP